MQKLVVAVWRAASASPDHVAAAVLDEWAAAALRDASVRGLVIDLADPDQGPYAREPDEQGLTPNVDAIISVWRDDARSLDALPSLDGVARRVEAWRVDEHRPKRYERTWPDGTRSPGVKMVSLMRRNLALTHEQFADHWLHDHAPLALRHHVGLWNYTQNVVAEALTAAGADVDGIAELHFASRADFTERFFDGPEGMRIIRDDVARFMTRTGSDAAVLVETTLRTHG